MSTSTIRAYHWVDGVLTDATTATLTDSGATYGVKRTDTDAVVVAAGTAMTKIATGTYEHSFTDPASGLSYQASIAMVYGGATRYEVHTWSMPVAMTDLTDLDPYIKPRVPGCQDALIHQAVRRVFRDFCRDTEVWTYRYTDLTVTDQAYYEFEPPSGTTVLKLEYVQIDEVDQSLETLEPDSDGFTFVYPPVEDDLVIDIKFSVVPDMDCTEAPTWLINRFGDGLVSGAIAYLSSMGGKPWTNYDDFKVEHARFINAIADARREKLQYRGKQAFVQVPQFL